MTEQVMHRYSRASEKAKALIVGTLDTPNPITRACGVIPLHSMRVGDALYFNKPEMILWKYKLARETAVRYNKKYNNMFAVLYNDDESVMEIVRIR